MADMLYFIYDSFFCSQIIRQAFPDMNWQILFRITRVRLIILSRWPAAKTVSKSPKCDV